MFLITATAELKNRQRQGIGKLLQVLPGLLLNSLAGLYRRDGLFFDLLL